ncbi:uncharacterized protein [Elaeis guineensis]
MCVWCWHHIIEMAKKDDTEGRCPACRSPYDKETILGRTISRERLAELNFEKKQKLQKAKLKTSEGRSDLTTIRVIKRNLVYVAGLPAKIADEETLRKKEFLGQYGKIIKIVIARDVGTNRLFPSFNTSVVYVTFSKEQEAFRCIEVVNGFILYGRTLKACFGTTRYCHAWLKNMPCRNPNCFYLHDAGPQEDICTKDEVASACLSKLPQNSGIALHNFERRSGSVLPPPRDNFCSSNSSVVKDKFLIHSVVYTPIDNGKRHFQNGDSGKSGVLPVAASWGSRLASGRSSYAGVAFSQGTIEYPSISNSSLAGVDIQALPQNAYQTRRQMIMSRNQMPLSNGHLENITSFKPYVEDGFREDMVMPNFKSSNCTSIMTNRSCCVTYREDMESRITQSSHSSDSVGFQPYASFSNDVKCSTMVENSQSSSCIPRSVSHGTTWDSGCLYGITEGVFSPVGYPVISSIEDTPVSNMQATILDPAFRAASSSQSLPLSFNRSSKFPDMTRMRSSADFEAKDISFLLDNRKFEGTSALVPGGTTIADPRVGEHSTCSVIIGLSCKGEQRKLQSEFSSCGINNFKLQHLECWPEKPISTETDIVLDSAVSNQANMDLRGDSMTSRISYVDFREDNSLPDKAKDDAGEDSIISDILSLDLGQVDHLIDHYSLRELLSGTNESDYSKSYNSRMPCNDSESKFSFASLDDSNSGKEQSFPLDSNVFALDMKTDQPDIKEKRIGSTNTSLSGLSAYDMDNPEILNCRYGYFACDVANELKLPSSLCQLASPVSRSGVLPSSGFRAGIRSIPPGFHPRFVDDQYLAFSKLTNSGSIAQYQISGNSPCINSSQENLRYNSFNDPRINQVNGSATASLCKGKLSRPMIWQFSLSSNSVSLAETDQALQFPARLGNLTQNSVNLANQSRNMTFQDMVNNYDGSWGSFNISSPTAMESGVTGRGQSALAEIIHHLIPGSNHGSWRLCQEHEKPGFQVPDSSRLLFNIQYEQS